ncbi:MAG: hypothetical protein IJB26_00490 [Clostridia bacterium]|nr:hypothetical protein [Clostridia bacterium]
MKKSIAFCLALLILIASFAVFPVSAANDIPLWSSSETAKTITVVYNNSPNAKPLSYRYVPTQTAEYAVKISLDSPIGGGFYTADGGFISSTYWEDIERGFGYEIYKLTAATEYLLTFGTFTAGSHTDTVSIIQWDNKLLTPDYPYLREGEKKTITVSAEMDGTRLLFTPSASGNYCFGYSGDSIYAEFFAVPKSLGESDSSSLTVQEEWKLGEQQGMVYQLESGNTYELRMRARSVNSAATATIWARQGRAPYGEWGDITKPKTITPKDGKTNKYYLSPSESGRYMVIHNSLTSLMLEDIQANSVTPIAFCNTCAEVAGDVYELIGGKEYVLTLSCAFDQGSNSSVKICFEKVGSVKSAEIFLHSFSSTDKNCVLGIDVNPICGGAVEGVKWSVSDPSVFAIKDSCASFAELKILKQGKATVTAKVGGVTASYELSTDLKAPVLQEGKTYELAAQFRNFNLVADFTPSRSGNYQFTMIPKIVHPDQKVCYGFGIGYDINYDNVYDKNDLSDKHTFTVNLKGGQHYYLTILGGRYSVTYKYVGNAPVQSSTTTATTHGGDNSTTITTGTVSKPSNNVIDFISTETKKVVLVGTGSLQQAASSGSAIRVEFPEDNVIVELDNAVVTSLSGAVSDEGVFVHSTQQAITDLNEQQQAALEGKELAMLLELKLTADGEEIHQLGGNAQITVPNPDKSKSWDVLYIAEDGMVETVDSTADDMSVTFSTSHFSHYALVSDGPQIDARHNKWILPVVIILLVIIGGAGTFFILKKKKGSAK